MSEGRLELRRSRDLSSLLNDSLEVYFRNIRTFVALAAAVVVPVELIVSGVGLEQLSEGYQEAELDTLIVGGALTFLVTTPLVTAMTVHALTAIAERSRASASAAISAGLDVFAPVFFAILLAAVAVAAGLVLFVLPGIWVAVRLYFVPQAVVVDGRRSRHALERSWELVGGSWWRVFGIGILATILVGIPAAVLQTPFELLAESADAAAWQLVGSIVAQTLALPLTSIVATLLYFDLRARREEMPAQVPPELPAQP